MNDNRYVAVYARQSVFNPDSISVDDQIEKSTRLADGETVVVYQDKGYTGANTQRPDFQRMMKDIQAGLIKKVIVWKLDRISRSVADFSLMINVFQEYDVSFSSVTESCLAIDDNPFSKAMIQIIMIFAELERNNIQARVRENYYSRLKMGMLGGGAAPFGFERAEYQINGKRCYMYIPNPSAAEIVQELYRMYVEDDCSLRDLSHWLYKNGISTTRENYWSSSTISRMMKNPVYVKADVKVYNYLQSKGVECNNIVEDYVGRNGVYLYGDRKIKGSTKRKAKYVDMSGDYATLAPHEGLVDSDMWLRAQAKLAENVSYGNSGNSKKSWLTGVAKCGYCGKAITFKQNKHYPIYVSCMGRQNKFCYDRKKVLRVEELEHIVEVGLMAFLHDLPVKAERQKAKNLPEIKKLEMELAKIDKRIENYMDRLELAEGALITHINMKVNELESERKELSSKLVKLSIEASKPVDGGLNIDDVIREWSSYDVEQKNIVAKTFIKRVVVTDDAIKVTFNGGGKDDDAAEVA